MIFWFLALALTGGTVASLLWPLMQKTQIRRWHLAALFLIAVLLPAGTMLLYYCLGAPVL